MLRLLCLVLLAGCAKSVAPSYAMYDEAGDYDAPAPAASMPEMEMAKKSSGRGAPAPAPRVISPGTPPSQPVAAESTQAPAEERMVHYEGYARLRVTHPEETADAVSALATGMGGYVEQLSSGRVTVRVPVAKFEEAFGNILALGALVEKSISAEDVTEAYAAVDLRLQIARSTRDRLVALLAKAKDESEKLMLLRQIQDVTEQIDTLEAQSRLYAQLADYSRITVQLDARPTLAYSAGEDGAAFAWIRQLSPFADRIEGKQLKLEVPTGFVALDEKRRFVAESADGARIWTDRLRNDPVGTPEYWMEAIRSRVAAEFKTAEVSTSGGWTRLRLVSPQDPAYTWVILLRVDGSWLDVAEVYYPAGAAETRHQAAVDAIFAAGGAS